MICAPILAELHPHHCKLLTDNGLIFAFHRCTFSGSPGGVSIRSFGRTLIVGNSSFVTFCLRTFIEMNEFF
jgi:hypothetical protein